MSLFRVNWIFSRLGSSYMEGGDNTFVNPYSYNILRKQPDIDFKVLADGSAFVVFCNVFLGMNLKRMSFDMTSLAPIVFEDALNNSKSIYFVGSKQQEIDGAIHEIKKLHPTLCIPRYRNGYFSTDERDQELDLLVDEAPDIVIVGMGTPLQEQFLIDLRNRGWKGTGFTCGGFLHQTASGIQYYPKWVDKLNLRWMYRIYDEPKLFKRYTIDYGKFVFLFLYDVIRYRLAKK